MFVEIFAATIGPAVGKVLVVDSNIVVIAALVNVGVVAVSTVDSIPMLCSNGLHQSTTTPTASGRGGGY